MKTYRYVGPRAIRERLLAASEGTPICNLAGLRDWVTAQSDEAEDVVVAPFVVVPPGLLRLANRRSEHVACAGGVPVLSAGEITISRDAVPAVLAVSNQSTGYCPDLDSWDAVETVLDQLGVDHPGRFTTPITFRRCESCDQLQIVKDDWFVCAVCGADLPMKWNCDRGT